MEVNKTFNFLKKTLSNLEKNLPYSLSELTGTSLGIFQLRGKCIKFNVISLDELFNIIVLFS